MMAQFCFKDMRDTTYAAHNYLNASI